MLQAAFKNLVKVYVMLIMLSRLAKEFETIIILFGMLEIMVAMIMVTTWSKLMDPPFICVIKHLREKNVKKDPILLAREGNIIQYS